MTYYAHSDPNGLAPDHPGARWQTLAVHLANTASMARRLAELAKPSDAPFHQNAYAAGLLHDLGKYSDCFQRRVRGDNSSCVHAYQGAALAFERLHAAHVSYAIAGHHAGLPDRTGGAGSLKAILGIYQAEGSRLAQIGVSDCQELLAWNRAVHPEPARQRGEFDLLTRMVASCLVDADRLDAVGRAPVQAPLCAQQHLQALLNHVAELVSTRRQDAAVAQARQAALADCLAAAARQERIFSLSVPTGGGKTIASMAFALRRAALQPAYRRIIVVIPYLSVIEQSAEVYANLLGRDAVLEHHSGALERLSVANGGQYTPAPMVEGEDVPLQLRQETENWDAPVVVTTSVRFFESLFSNRPSDLRRVHNIARSIVVLDEVQVLPRRLLAPLLRTISELALHWGCTFLLATATQPAFERPSSAAGGGRAAAEQRWAPGSIREVIRDPKSLHRAMRRVKIDWRLSEASDWPTVAGWLSGHRQAFCVVNTREHASTLFDELTKIAPGDSLFHLSSRMCAAHRLQVVEAVKLRLRQGLNCRLVSTQVIEVGVDIDFPAGYRSIGPLDSIMQAAGRVDREGILTAAAGKAAGRLVVFVPPDNRMPPHEYREAADKTLALAKSREIQCGDLDVVREFFDRYFGEGADLGAEFDQLAVEGKFRTIAERFEIINSRCRDVFIPWRDGRGLIDRLNSAGRLTSDLRRSLQRFVVGLQPWEFSSFQKGALWEVRPGSNLWVASEPFYTEIKGLQIEAATERMIC